MAKQKIAVVGAGLIGLSTAVYISESISKCSVTVISDKFTPNTTSDVAAGMLIPHTYQGIPIHQQKQWFRETFDYLFEINNSSEASDAGINLVSGLKENGCQVYARRIEDLWELHSKYDIVVNCSGIGSRELMGDLEIHPVRGQVLKVDAPWVNHFIRDGDGLTYIYPGIHNVTLGGTRQKDNWSLSPDPRSSKDIFDRCCALEPSLQRAQDIKVRVGLRPSRLAVRLQKEILVHDGKKLPVVHNYGHGSGGFSVHRGTAKEAARLVGECIAALEGSSLKAKL
uniref:D-aspartate oxidase n=1 Tax=Gopherus agassizii TaxID=38772 RepID=A0A452IGJ2_9SAUR